MIKINRQISIDENEIEEQFVRASGPGGQNVNKVSTAVRLRFNVPSSALPAPVRERLMRLAGARTSASGDIVILAQRYRTQAQNRADARHRLIGLIQAALEPRKFRKKTQPSRSAKQRRLQTKLRRGELKRVRKDRIDFD